MTVVKKWHGGKAKAANRKARRKALRAGAEHILSMSNLRVPLEEGTLERSGAVTLNAEGDEAAVSYDTVYARRQHEELTWKHDPGRSAKYLELALDEHGDEALAIMSARYRAALR